MQHATDHRNRLFIDRDPELFGVLLQFLRAQTLPTQSYIKANRQALTEECRFFQILHLEHYLRGHTSTFDLRWEDREIKEREANVRTTGEDRNFLVNVFETCTRHRDPIEMELPLLKKASTRHLEVNCSFATFCSRYSTLTHGLVDALENTSGVVFAGGSVVGTLTQSEVGDVDIFLICALGEATTALERIYDAVRNLERETKQKKTQLLVTRSKHAVTIFRVCDGNLLGLPIQVILSVYKNVGHLLSSFDLDSCAAAFVPGKGVYCSPRCLRALRYSVNVFDSDLEGPTYCQRLEKWDARGFQIALPGLVLQRVSSSVKEGIFYRLTTTGLLLRMMSTPQQRLKEGVIQHCKITDKFESFWPKYLYANTVADGADRLQYIHAYIHRACCFLAQAPGRHEARRDYITN